MFRQFLIFFFSVPAIDCPTSCPQWKSEGAFPILSPAAPAHGIQGSQTLGQVTFRCHQQRIYEGPRKQVLELATRSLLGGSGQTRTSKKFWKMSPTMGMLWWIPYLTPHCLIPQGDMKQKIPETTLAISFLDATLRSNA